MDDEASNARRTVRVPLAALVAVQEMLRREGLDDVITDLSDQHQVDLSPTLSGAGRLGLDVSGIRPGPRTFAEGLVAARHLSDRTGITGLPSGASVKISLALIKGLQAKLGAMPGLVARDHVAKAIVDCTTPDPFNCPDHWPGGTG